MTLLKQYLLRLHDNFVPHARNGYHPHALRHRSLHLYAGLLLSFKIATLFSLGLLPENQAYSSAINIPNIIQLTNNSRQAAGLGALTENGLLDQAAQAKADDMLKNQYFEHTSPEGKTPWDWIKTSGYNYIIAGENLAVNFSSSESVESAWMNSPGHRANILNRDFKDIGIGITEGTYKGVDAIFVVQMFGTSIDQPIVAKNTFTTPQTLPQQEAVAAPDLGGKAKLLSAPVLNSPAFELTNKKVLALSGRAEGASQVYIFDNNKPLAQLSVSNSQFSGEVQLSEGINQLNAMSIGSEKVSPLSNTITVKVDSTAPQITSTEITPVNVDGQQEYMVQVQAQGDAVKIVANMGGENVLLQPTDNENVWSGRFSKAAGKVLQGKISVTAYDLAGNRLLADVANISTSVIGDPSASHAPEQFVRIFNKNIGLSAVDDIYLAFIGAMLVMLALAIGKHPRIQHLSLIAHTSVVIMIATFLWLH